MAEDDKSRENNDSDDSMGPDDCVPYEFNMDDLFPDGMPDGLSASDQSAGGSAVGQSGSVENVGGIDGKPADDQAVDGQGDNHQLAGNMEAFEQEFGDKPEIDFDDELAGLIGDKAKVAILITRIVSADLLAAFCSLSDISADCLSDSHGAIAVLRNLDGDAPESAAKDLTSVVQGMSAVLCVNRADKLESSLYIEGKATKQKFPPPMLFDMAPAVVEDLELGLSNVRELKAKGETVVDTADFNRRKALKVIAGHIKFHRNGPAIE